MNRRTSARLAAAATALAIGGGATLAPSPALAVTYTCTGWQNKEFATSGFNTDVSIRLCVSAGTSSHRGYADIQWSDGGGVKKFDNFDVNIRLERYDADHDTKSCGYESAINLYDTGAERCYEVVSYSTASGGWSVDGSVAYDYDADGAGGMTWSLTGTPLIS